ncbi:MAG: hypothetical protein JOS17DRAFT_197747 [Linnemannia elongata]|nr:MAG: hypothetical protein JOS17DRAFT_197747 [Linnemannia elongata]
MTSCLLWSALKKGSFTTLVNRIQLCKNISKEELMKDDFLVQKHLQNAWRRDTFASSIVQKKLSLHIKPKNERRLKFITSGVCILNPKRAACPNMLALKGRVLGLFHGIPRIPGIVETEGSNCNCGKGSPLGGIKVGPCPLTNSHLSSQHSRYPPIPILLHIHSSLDATLKTLSFSTITCYPNPHFASLLPVTVHFN